LVQFLVPHLASGRGEIAIREIFHLASGVASQPEGESLPLLQVDAQGFRDLVNEEVELVRNEPEVVVKVCIS